jgi:predicted DNA-binding protein
MNNGMQIMTHRTTFALDQSTAQRLKRLASRWNVSQAEVVRRSLEKTEQAEITPPDVEQRIESARRLRDSLRGKISAEEWIKMVQEARR